jgi:uncharacterized protein YndB with AHSA1/START domain
MESVVREVVVDGTPADVWDAVTDLGEWFGADVDGEIEPGELVRFSWPGLPDRRAIIERVAEPRELIFRWLPGALPPSRVEITIDECENGSVVRVTEQRFDAAVTPNPEIGFRALAPTLAKV